MTHGHRQDRAVSTGCSPLGTGTFQSASRSVNTLVLGSRDTLNARFVAAMSGEPQGAYISFDSPELLFRVLTPGRWNIIRSMTGAGSLSVQALAEWPGIDVASVQHDVQALLDTGVLDRNADDAIEFPYDAVHVDFMITAA